MDAYSHETYSELLEGQGGGSAEDVSVSATRSKRIALAYGVTSNKNKKKKRKNRNKNVPAPGSQAVYRSALKKFAPTAKEPGCAVNGSKEHSRPEKPETEVDGQTKRRGKDYVRAMGDLKDENNYKALSHYIEELKSRIKYPGTSKPSVHEMSKLKKKMYDQLEVAERIAAEEDHDRPQYERGTRNVRRSRSRSKARGRAVKDQTKWGNWLDEYEGKQLKWFTAACVCYAKVGPGCGKIQRAPCEDATKAKSADSGDPYAFQFNMIYVRPNSAPRSLSSALRKKRRAAATKQKTRETKYGRIVVD